jgi:hypothetical protein
VWWAPTTDLFIYLDRNTAHVRSASGAWPARRVRDAAHAVRARLVDSLLQARAGAKPSRFRMHVLLASSLCRFLLLENTRQLRNDAEVLSVAAGPLKERLGLDPTEWTCTLDREWDRTALVCAMRVSVLDELRAAAAVADARLVSVRPWIGELLRARNGQLNRFQALGVIEPDAVSLLTGHTGSTHVQTLLLNDGSDPLAAVRYLAQSAGAVAESLPVVQLDAAERERGSEPARADFSDRVQVKSGPS